MLYECERCESHSVTVKVTSNGVYVCSDCWIDGEDKE
jgi:ribosomal protein L37AE/L43A